MKCAIIVTYYDVTFFPSFFKPETPKLVYFFGGTVRHNEEWGTEEGRVL